PLDAAGYRRENLCAFLRESAETTVLIVVPRLVAWLAGMSGLPPVGFEIWRDTKIMLPEDLAGARFLNLLTGESIDGGGASPNVSLEVGTILRSFPVAVLEQARAQ